MGVGRSQSISHENETVFRRTDGGVFAADVVNHNGGHDDGDDVDEARRWVPPKKEKRESASMFHFCVG